MWLCLATSGHAQTLPSAPSAAASAAAPAAPVGTRLRPTMVLSKRVAGSELGAEESNKPALVLSARSVVTRIDQESLAEGDAELRYGELLLRAQRLGYQQVDDLARATGGVEISRAGSVFRGPELSLYVNRFEGEFLSPSYFFSQTGGSGKATRLRFIDAKHMLAEGGTYSSCPVDENQPQPAWEISAQSLSMDFDANEGVAKGAVLRFYGVPILPAPTLSFPLAGQRKSGWLPPNIRLDKRSGVEFGLPYYWNLAPQRDATLTPFLMTRRGPGLDSEFRYLEPQHAGELNLALLPSDRVARRTRWALNVLQDGELGMDWRYHVRAERVSDDDYWKDLPERVKSQAQRLLMADLQLERRREWAWGEGHAYARLQRWQTLQGQDPLARFDSPYQRSPQIGLRLNTAADDSVLDGFRPWGRKARLEGAIELEYNRFDLPDSAPASQARAGGQRTHMLAHLSAPLGGAAWWLIPRFEVNVAHYVLDQAGTDGLRSKGRTVPTFSLDHGWIFERDTRLFGRALTQTLEPRLLYVNTPYRAQENLPRFDSAAKDFNFDSIYTANQFSGIDRVSDAHQLTAGATSRWVNANDGDEVLRLGLVQRFQFRDQRITADNVPVKQRFSDLLLLGAAHLDTRWWLDGALQYNSDSGRSERAVLRARYSPGTFQTVSVAYRLARQQSEQVELAWQWPLFGKSARGGGGSGCSGAWYSAGRVQYSLRDRRLTDSVLGFEYDAGCWVLRVGAERLSTGRAETNTRLMLQMELVGLSQLGSNALKVLRDNIPGYRQLSSERSASLEAPYD
ncbi:LPS-assembly protein LptD [Roseateles sp.]|uniref:LPS-assembly protein LptD n=1 Tax=Roseateles sp. TaxID=1971397 RepID=UPI003D0BF1C2